MEVRIPLTEPQAQQLAVLYEARQRADREFVLYANAIVAGSDYGTVKLKGFEPLANGTPPFLLVETLDGREPSV